MLFQQGPANTFNYMVLGFTVILGIMILFVASLMIRFHNLERDKGLLEEMEAKGKPKATDPTVATFDPSSAPGPHSLV